MKRSQRISVAGLTLPLRAWMSRFALALMLLTALVLMVLSNNGAPVVERARTTVVDGVSPVLGVLVRPAHAVAGVVEGVRSLVLLFAENRRLREDNDRLRRWLYVAQQLEAENDALRTQLGFVPDPKPRFITARVIGDTGGAFVHSLLVGAGDRDGLRRGQAAVAGEGLAGRIAEVGDRSARLLLLTDINSRVPVIIESTGDRAILAGNNGPRPQLQFLPSKAPVSPGDVVFTSGHGGVFPPGLPVGMVVQVSESTISVEPVADLSRVRFVRVLDFGVDGLLPAPGEYDIAPAQGAP
ncbi:MAG: rod shape-determining protein MreC [Alphaproteobacteria bacterium]